MQTFLFDNQPESVGIWEKLVAESGARFKHAQDWRGPEHLSSECQVVVIDRSAVQEHFARTVSKAAMVSPNQVLVATAADWKVNEIVEIMRYGVDYVFEKPLDKFLIRSVLPEILEDARKIREKLAEYGALQKLFNNLTHRERDVLNCVLEGVSNKDSASQLKVSVRTIEARRAKVYGKTQSKSVVDLVRKVDRLIRLSQIFDTSNRTADVQTETTHLAGPWYRRSRNALLLDGSELLYRERK